MERNQVEYQMRELIASHGAKDTSIIIRDGIVIPAEDTSMMPGDIHYMLTPPTLNRHGYVRITTSDSDWSAEVTQKGIMPAKLIQRFVPKNEEDAIIEKREYLYLERQTDDNDDYAALSLSCYPFESDNQTAAAFETEEQAARAMLCELEENPLAITKLKEISIICQILGFEAWYAWNNNRTFHEILVPAPSGSIDIHTNIGRAYINISAPRHFLWYSLHPQSK